MIPSIFNATFILDTRTGPFLLELPTRLAYRHSFVCTPFRLHDGRDIISLRRIFKLVPTYFRRVKWNAAGRAWLGFPKGKREAV